MYKRQVRPLLLQDLQLLLEFPDHPCKGGQPGRGTGTVSYTHLDVYKRQEFKRSERLHEHIVCINSLEEEADKLFIACMYDLHSTCKDPLTVIAWREIYLYLEKCADTCEHIADMVESTIMKNS